MKAISNSVSNFFIQYFIALFFNLVNTLIHECAVIMGSFYTIKSTSILDMHCIWTSYKIYSYYKMPLVLWPFLRWILLLYLIFMKNFSCLNLKGKNKKLILIMHRHTISKIWFKYLISHNTLFNIFMFVYLFYFYSRFLPFMKNDNWFKKLQVTTSNIK